MTNPIVLQQLGGNRPNVKRSLRGAKRDMLIAALRNSPLFMYATEKDLRNVVKHAHHGRAAAGTTIMHEGDPADRYYVVLDGSVRVTRKGRKLTDLAAGKGFGELALLLDTPRNASVTAVEESELVSFDRKTFAKLLDESPAFARRLMQAVAARLREVDAKAVQ
jgi:CRP-like cAMP-binding protein